MIGPGVACAVAAVVGGAAPARPSPSGRSGDGLAPCRKFASDAALQTHVPRASTSGAFARSETALQLSWALGRRRRGSPCRAWRRPASGSPRRCPALGHRRRSAGGGRPAAAAAARRGRGRAGAQPGRGPGGGPGASPGRPPLRPERRATSAGRRPRAPPVPAVAPGPAAPARTTRRRPRCRGRPARRRRPGGATTAAVRRRRPACRPGLGASSHGTRPPSRRPGTRPWWVDP